MVVLPTPPLAENTDTTRDVDPGSLAVSAAWAADDRAPEIEGAERERHYGVGLLEHRCFGLTVGHGHRDDPEWAPGRAESVDDLSSTGTALQQRIHQDHVGVEIADLVHGSPALADSVNEAEPTLWSKHLPHVCGDLGHILDQHDPDRPIGGQVEVVGRYGHGGIRSERIVGPRRARDRVGHGWPPAITRWKGDVERCVRDPGIGSRRPRVRVS